MTGYHKAKRDPARSVMGRNRAARRKCRRVAMVPTSALYYRIRIARVALKRKPSTPSESDSGSDKQAHSLTNQGTTAVERHVTVDHPTCSLKD